MKKEKLLAAGINGYLLFSAFSVLSVSLLAFFQPQAVMDLVQVKLQNTDAFSSIRGVYGGVGLTFCVALVYLFRRDKRKGLAMLSVFWGLYALSRVTTVFVEGPLGSFGSRWLVIESTLFALAQLLLVLSRKAEKKLAAAS